MRDDNQTIFCSPYVFLSICTVISFYKKWGYEIVKVETRYLWFNIKHITVPVKKIAIIHCDDLLKCLWDHMIMFFNPLFFLLDNSDFFMGSTDASDV